VRRDLEVRRDSASCESRVATDTCGREAAARQERRADWAGALSEVTGFEMELAFELHRHWIWEPLVPVVLVLEGAVAVG
jgi:hypothetical protein